MYNYTKMHMACATDNKRLEETMQEFNQIVQEHTGQKYFKEGINQRKQNINEMTESVGGNRIKRRSKHKMKETCYWQNSEKDGDWRGVGAWSHCTAQQDTTLDRGRMIATKTERERASVKPCAADMRYKSPGSRWQISTGSICCTSAGTQNTPSIPAHPSSMCVSSYCMCLNT